MLTAEEEKYKEQDHNLQLVVLFTLIIEKIEYLEARGYIYGSIKMFLKNSKVKYERFLSQVFSIQEKIEEDSALIATNKLLVMQERVELALINQHILTVDERRDRTKEILRKHYPGITIERLKDIISDMEDRNLFNF